MYNSKSQIYPKRPLSKDETGRGMLWLIVCTTVLTILNFVKKILLLYNSLDDKLLWFFE
jgi:hypothetical protein